MSFNPQDIAAVIPVLKVLIVDDEAFARKVARSLLMNIGIRNIVEAFNGADGLDAICSHKPDLVLLDWDMPVLNGPAFMKRVRSPKTFPVPHVPVIMVTGHGERERVVEAVRLGVHEYLLKPISSQTLKARITSVIAHPRPMVQRGDYYGPEPRKMWTYKPDADPMAGRILVD